MLSFNGLCSGQTEELQLVRDALRSLRNSFGGHDPQHHTLDTLEQGMASLMDRLYTLESQTRRDRKVGAFSKTVLSQTFSLLLCSPCTSIHIVN